VFEIAKSIKCEEGEESESQSIMFEEEDTESFELSMAIMADPLSVDNFDTPTSTSQSESQGQDHIQLLCGYCHVSFLEESSLISHLSTHNENEELKFHRCKYCYDRFKDYADLERHLRIHNPYKCNENSCVKSFTRKSDLTKHLKTHVKRPSIYICKYCSEKTSSQTMLYEHLLIHKKERTRNMLECPRCEKLFQSRNELSAHLRNDTHEKTHVCVECSKPFYLKIELDVHFKNCHEKNRPYTCEICNRSFVQKETLVTHKLLHTGQQPFKCDKCDRSYLSNYSLKQHQRSHTTPLSQRLL